MTWTPPDPGQDPYSGSPPHPPGSQPYPPGAGYKAPFPPAAGYQQPPPFPPASGYQQPPPFPPADGQQHPAQPGYSPSPSQGKRTGPARLSWRLAHSAWLVTVLLPFSCFSAVGFIYVGVRARRTAWWIAGIFYSVVANVCFFVGGEGADDSTQQNVAFTIMFLLWPISIGHAFVVNGAWLRWRAGHVPWYSRPQPVAWTGAPTPAATPLPPQLQDVVPPPQQFYGAVSEPTPDPVSPPAPASGSVLPPAPASGSVPPSTPAFNSSPLPAFVPEPDRLDVNTADERQFAALPGWNAERAARIVAARQARGGFSSLTEFAAVAGFAPHEFVAVRDRLSCDPPPPRNPTDPPPYGRIVDV
ncbi:ComEA family DNA-binding protein [Actinoplanes aureus]|uniref:Helix-hairpin-helix domain-containing protein n=1 Tax=Actinoplanes aureus TaxID=2792083 RepID=A0A931CEX1_9ACTN|nr:helix-hairpin-helix domain-containing protein [Actinoplanes aureus]MBG0564948.1 helix-hairpin-helix domain-containing protein [Actinoplanes aureus]